MFPTSATKPSQISPNSAAAASHHISALVPIGFQTQKVGYLCLRCGICQHLLRCACVWGGGVACACVCVRVCECVYIYVCMRICRCSCLSACLSVCLCVYIHTCIHAYIHFIQEYIHTYIDTRANSTLTACVPTDQNKWVDDDDDFPF